MGVGGELEKVKVTPKTAEVIKNSLEKYPKHQIVRNYDSIGFRYKEEMDLDTLIRALYIGYEAEPEFKVGDFIEIYLLGQNAVVEITGINNADGRIRIKGSSEFNEYNVIRKLTPEEIQQEKERRKWSEIGRKPLEFHPDDIVKDTHGDFGFYYRAVLRIADGKARCTGGVDVPLMKLKLVCPAEKRFDLNEL